jgi:hypothetical protein
MCGHLGSSQVDLGQKILIVGVGCVRTISATEMALVLSHMRGTLSNLTPKSLMVCTIQRIYEQQLAAATYSASVVDCTTEDCFREDQ